MILGVVLCDNFFVKNVIAKLSANETTWYFFIDQANWQHFFFIVWPANFTLQPNAI